MNVAMDTQLVDRTVKILNALAATTPMTAAEIMDMYWTKPDALAEGVEALLAAIIEGVDQDDLTFALDR